MLLYPKLIQCYNVLTESCHSIHTQVLSTKCTVTTTINLNSTICQQLYSTIQILHNIQQTKIVEKNFKQQLCSVVGICQKPHPFKASCIRIKTRHFSAAAAEIYTGDARPLFSLTFHHVNILKNLHRHISMYVGASSSHPYKP